MNAQKIHVALTLSVLTCLVSTSVHVIRDSRQMLPPATVKVGSYADIRVCIVKLKVMFDRFTTLHCSGCNVKVKSLKLIYAAVSRLWKI
mgnify:CR=1 FL=1